MRWAVLVLIIAAGPAPAAHTRTTVGPADAALAAAPLTTEMPAQPVQPAHQPGPVFEHIDAMYDAQGNLVAADLDGVNMDSLYWKDYYSTTYLKSSDKVTNPSPANRVAMSFHDAQSCPCITPDGEYVYEAYGTYLYRFSTADGSMTTYSTSYSGSTICGTDGQYIYRPNGTSIYKFTMTGTYVNTTTINYSAGQYAFAVANDTVWVGSGYTYYGYGCNRFTGGSINNDVTWNTGMSGATMMNVGFDGTYYYISCGGYSSNTFCRFYKDRTTYTTGTVYIDTRSVMAGCTPGLSMDSLYHKQVGYSYLRGSPKVQNPAPTNRLAMTWQNDQTVTCATPAGDYVFEAYGTTLRRHNAATGAYNNYTLSYTAKGCCGTDGAYVFVPRSGSAVIDKYSMSGSYVNSTTVNYNGTSYGFAVANDTVWLTTAMNGTPTWYGYAASQFTGGSINNSATWTMGDFGSSTPMDIAWDGTYYYATSGGLASNPFFRYNANRTLYSSGTITDDSRSVMCRVPPRHDCGVTRIVAPTGAYDSGAAVTPACSLYNYGNAAEAAYKVRLTIGSYVDSATVSSHAPGTYVYTTFASWSARPRGTLAVTCSTRVAGDVNTGNDKATGSATVNVRDAAVTHLLAPVGSYDSGMVVTPSCSVSNYGTAAMSCNVRMKIGAVYNEAVYVDAQAAGTRAHVTFPGWTAGTRGTYAVSCSTELAGDMKTANDRRTGTAVVNVPDVGVVAVIGPSGSIPAGTVFAPACTVNNYGSNTPASYVVRCRIGAVYNKTLAVLNQAPGSKRYCVFPSWTAVAGSWTLSCSTELAGDVVKGNDRKSRPLLVTSGGSGIGVWSTKNPMPAGAKPMKDGAWLAYDESNGRMFGSRGNKQPDFYAYAPDGDSWGARAPWPLGVEGKMPHKGSAGCTDGNGHTYAVKGNNTTGFYRYDDATNVWTRLRDIPLGPSNKRVKSGTDIEWALRNGVGMPFLMKGNRNEFFRYNVAADSWEDMKPAPLGQNVKWDKGSWLAYDAANNQLFAFKAKYMEFYSYDPDNDAWSAALAPMPIVGSTGSKKAKDGSCGAYLDGCIYALKGGNTQQFFRYTVATNSWVEMETIPRGIFKKKVNAGGDDVAAGTVIYATKGNKTNELWKYTPGDTALFAPPRRDGVAASGVSSVECRVSIAPNPLASGFATVSFTRPLESSNPRILLSIYSVTGQRVMAQAFAIGRSGAVDLDLRHLSNGVYLVKLETGGFTTQQKLVVQR